MSGAALNRAQPCERRLLGAATRWYRERTPSARYALGYIAHRSTHDPTMQFHVTQRRPSYMRLVTALQIGTIPTRPGRV